MGLELVKSPAWKLLSSFITGPLSDPLVRFAPFLHDLTLASRPLLTFSSFSPQPRRRFLLPPSFSVSFSLVFAHPPPSSLTPAACLAHPHRLSTPYNPCSSSAPCDPTLVSRPIFYRVSGSNARWLVRSGQVSRLSEVETPARSVWDRGKRSFVLWINASIMPLRPTSREIVRFSRRIARASGKCDFISRK